MPDAPLAVPPDRRRGVSNRKPFHGAVVSWARGLARDLPLLLVGYSFGAWCAIRHAAGDRAVAAVIAVGLPARMYPLGETIGSLHQPLAVLQGSDDEFGAPEDVRRIAPDARLRVVEGASHLFPGRAAEAGSLVAEIADELLPGPGEGGSGQ